MENVDRSKSERIKDKDGHQPLVSVITINYNGLDDTCELIDSLVQHIHSVDYEIVVVDNASRMDEAKILREKYPSIVAIRSDKNLGFSGGNNLGIRNAKGEYLFFLNNDTYVCNDGFRALVDAVNQKPSIAAVSPKLLNPSPENTIQFAGYTPLSKVTLRNSVLGEGDPDDGRWDTAYSIPIVHGAAMFFKRSAIERVGMMPEIYFLYYEELDWSAAVLRAGMELWYAPACAVYHKGSKSTGAYSPLQVFYMTRNRMLYAWRNIDGLKKWLSILYLLFVANTKACVLFVREGKFSLVKACFRGINAFFSMKK
jgi:Predicted glycosyltransferases